VLFLALAAVGCAERERAAEPTCSSKQLDPLILVAQSVPSASRIPCIEGYPAGWRLAAVHVESGRTSITLDSDRAGMGALRVTLERSCAVDGATEVPTDEAETRRFERILSIDSGFSAVRSYRFDGGCVSYRFRFKGQGQALVNEASIAMGFVSRVDIDARLRKESHAESHLLTPKERQ
jgi:hypothetical protein